MRLHVLVFCSLILILLTQSKADTDTLYVSIQQADSIFVKQNLTVLASGMNIEAQKAQIIQAKLYPNPVFTAEINAIDPENKKFAHIGQTGQKVFQFEQLIVLGGKRKAEIEIARTHTKIAELEFEHLLSQLKYQLRTDLFLTGQLRILLEKYQNQLALIDTLLNIYQIQASKNNIPQKDIVRLKGAYLKLNNDRAEFLKQYYEAQQRLQTLLQTQSIVVLRFEEAGITKYIKNIPLQELMNIALTQRPELLIKEQDLQLAQQTFNYQKKLAIPDISAFTSYDQRGGAFQNQINAGIAIPLPFFHRNQGNIKTSQYKVKQTQYEYEALKNEIMTTIQNSYAFYKQTVAEYQKAMNLYNPDFETTFMAMTINFQKRNINIIEFLDFFEAYNEVLIELARIRTQLVISGEQLNFLTGKEVY